MAKESYPEQVVAKVAHAIEETHYESLDQALANLDLKVTEFQDLFRGLYSENDRSLAIVSYAYIDDRLRDLYSQTLNPQISGGVKSLLDGMGPLNNSSARIQLAAGLYWLQPKTYSNLGLLRKIRNEFAHDPHVSSFSDNRISGYLTSMDPTEEVVLDVLSGLPDGIKLSLREIFFIRSVITCQAMIAEVATAPIAQRMGLPSTAALRRGYDKQPQQVIELLRAASSVIVDFLGSGVDIPEDDS